MLYKYVKTTFCNNYHKYNNKLDIFFPTEKLINKENSKFCSQDQAVTLTNITKLDVSPDKPSDSPFFLSEKVEANRQALHEICEYELVYELTLSRLEIS